MKQKKWIYTLAAVVLIILVAAHFLKDTKQPEPGLSLENIPPFSWDAFVVLDNNQPGFTAEDLKTDAYEFYSDLDHLGRCGYTMACIGKELMPTEDRESISHIKPSGWNQAQYDVVDGKNLYNRCHLIGFQLTGENDNEKNLITGTRYMNVEGMLPFENMVVDYIKETNNHVLYRVTPIYEGNNLVATGVQLEAKSVEDGGEGICFHVFVYNSQPGVTINYADGSSRLADSSTDTSQSDTAPGKETYILNTKSKKFHTAACAQGESISDSNRDEYTGDRQSLIDDGYEPAGCCKP
ncbi:MAG: DNA/RNA non-specific endonuclease [Oscillospiraceae bacterium]|nr:DNA/RNA non-specific endonuclease [Oscillospiraceae bacterium]